MMDSDSTYADEPAKTFNPFPGLRPFETDEYTLFFGRDGQSDELLARLGKTRFLAVVGTSGSGKSSLIRAGLLPALHGGLMAGAGSAWRIALFRPGGDPLGNLAAALCSEEALGAGAGDADVQAAIVEATLRRSTLGLVDVVRQARLSKHENLLVVVDQFEELFRFRTSRETQGSEDDAAAFVKLLLEAPQPKAREELAARRKQDPNYEPPTGQEVLPIYVVLTMRSDFLGDCAQFQGLPEAINDGQYLIPRMTRDERRAAITGPAAVGGGEISLPLVNRLLNDVGDNPDQLPIMQHALMRTWNHWAARCDNGNGGNGDAACEVVELSDYEAVGGMSDALSRHADEAYNELPDERARLVAEKMFKALTEKGADNREIRRPVTLGELCAITEATTEEVSMVVETFRHEGRSFLMPPVGTPLEPETVIDISHESLIRNWQRLKKWVDEEAQSARIYRRLAEAATLHGAGQESLAAGAGLQVALDWRTQARPNSAWASRYHPAYAGAMSFLDQSKTAHEAAIEERERQREEQLARERRELENAQALAEQQALSLKQAQALAEEQEKFAEQQTLSLEQAQTFADEQKKFADQQSRSALRARRLTFVMVFLALIAVGTAAFALRARAAAGASLKQAVESEAEARVARQQAEDASKNLYESLVKQNEAKEEADRARKIAEESKAKAVAEQEKAEAEKNRANEQARIAAVNLADAQKANKAAQQAIHQAKVALDRAVESKNQEVAAGQRGQLLRQGIEAYRREEFEEALGLFNSLSAELEKLLPDSPDATGGGNFSPDQLKQHKLELGWTRANIGATHLKMPDPSYDEAVKIYEEAYAILNPLFPADSNDPILFDTYHGLAHAYLGNAKENRKPTRSPQMNEKRAVKSKEYFKKAEDFFKLALDFQLRHKADDPSESAAAYLNLARLYVDANMVAEADASYRSVFDIRRKAITEGDDDSQIPARTELAAVYKELAEFYTGQYDLEKAVKVYGEMIAMQEEVPISHLAEAAPLIADSYTELAQLLNIKDPQGEADEDAFRAAGLLQQVALKLHRGGARHAADNLDDDYDGLGDVYLKFGKFKDAEVFYQQALSLREETEEGKKNLPKSYDKLAMLYRLHLKDYAKAEEFLKKAAEASAASANKLPQAVALEQLASLYAVNLKKYPEAEAQLENAIAIYARTGEWPRQDAALVALADVYRRQNKDVEPVYDRRLAAAARFSKFLTGPARIDLRMAARNTTYFTGHLKAVGELADFYASRGKSAQVAAAYSQTQEIMTALYGRVFNVSVLDSAAAQLEKYQSLLRDSNKTAEATAVGETVKKLRERQTQQREQQQAQQQEQQQEPGTKEPASPSETPTP